MPTIISTDRVNLHRKLRMWDMRLGSGNTGVVRQTEEDPTTSSASGRPRGITSIVKGVAQSRGAVFGLAFNSQVHVYNETDLTTLHRDYGSNGIEKTMRCMSYWIKMCISRNGQHLVSGGQDGTAFMWNTGRATDVDNARVLQDQVPILSALHGHEGEVGPVEMDGDGVIVTCGVDGTVRFWREVADEVE